MDDDDDDNHENERLWFPRRIASQMNFLFCANSLRVKHIRLMDVLEK